MEIKDLDDPMYFSLLSSYEIRKCITVLEITDQSGGDVCLIYIQETYSLTLIPHFNIYIHFLLT